MPAGRPLKFETVEILQEKIDTFFKQCDDNKEPYTITGLALALDTNRKTLIRYEDRDVFSHTVKKAKLKCENYVEKLLLSGNNAAGSIFALKNYDWSDKSEVENYGKGGGAIEHKWTVEVVEAKGE